jgi:quinol-cytochrome oxidoreductase complex cytochrome b subunit/mono/diheme cytochrome c family protein
MDSRFHKFLLIPAALILLGGFFLFAGSVSATSHHNQTLIGTPSIDRPGPIPTVYPPSQADTGAQVYWGMCQDCHGDQGQGLAAEWRAAFAPEYQDCWAPGCHGDDAPSNSFILPETGAPALAGPGALPQFSSAFKLGTYIYGNMPLSPPGSLTSDQSWELTAYILSLNNAGSPTLFLNSTNSAAISLQGPTNLPEQSLPGVALFGLFLLIGAGGYFLRTKGLSKNKTKGNFYHHLHPASLPAKQARIGYTLGAGGIAVFLCLVLLVTGLLETYYYLPDPQSAASSIQTLTTLVPYGDLVRNLHFWAAQFLVLVLMVHLGRIILTGAYAPPRRFNYLLGLFLLVAALLLDFTGYVLRWDEGIRWALVVGTNLLKTIPGIGENLYRFILGGDAPGTTSLIRFYSWHIYGLTILFAGVTAWHIFRVRRDGGISAPPKSGRKPQPRIHRAELVRTEVLAMLLGGALLLMVSALIPAPIDQPLSPNGTLAGDSGAPWFFLWIQETLKIGDPFLWGVGVPLIAVLILGLLPYLLPNAEPEELGQWFPRGNRAAQIIGMAVITVIFALTLLGWLS